LPTNKKTGVTLAMVQGIERSFITFRGENATYCLDDIDFSKIYADIVHLPSYFLMDGLRHDYIKLMDVMHAAGIPVRYPVACSPQAWSAGSIPYMLTASLGISPDALDERLTLEKPNLPEWLKRVTISSLHVGGASVKLEFERAEKSTLVRVVEKRGHLEVDVV
jgi:hypothetical protein